jgi:hypothetical protein
LTSGLWVSCEELENEILSKNDGSVRNCFVTVFNDSICALVDAIPNIATPPALSFPIESWTILETELPKTLSLKLDRKKILERFGDLMKQNLKAFPQTLVATNDGADADAVCLARMLLNVENVDPSRSFLENGANSLLCVKFSHYFSETNAWELPLKTLGPAIRAFNDDEEKMDQQKFQVIFEADLSLKSSHNLTDATLSPAEEEEEGAVLLTGASGFVGLHILDDLVTKSKTVFVLVRGGLKRFEKLNVLQISLKNVTVLDGDLEQPWLGLEEERYEELAGKISQVIHCAARVNFAANYNDLRSVNVLGTLKMCEFATLKRAKKLVYISTKSCDNADFTFEGGYASSKYCGEKIVENSIADHQIVRLPVVLFNTSNGRYNASDWLCRLICSCMRFKVLPEDVKTQLVCCKPNEMDLEDLQMFSLSLDLFFLTLARIFPEFKQISIFEMCSLFLSTDCAATPVVPLLRETLRAEKTFQFPQLELSEKEIGKFVDRIKQEGL